AYYSNFPPRILDVGHATQLTKDIEAAFDRRVDNTTGDLDGDFEIPAHLYDVIVFSHTLEHIFDPVHCLLRLREQLRSGGRLFVVLPRRGKLLWTKNHYHEIDHYRFKLLMKRTGFHVIDWEHSKTWRPVGQYLKGLRPFYRIFREFNITYQCVPNFLKWRLMQ
ncbi:hypothetical protein LCGC14_2965570, partial [marine sediment metagenome]